MCDEAQQQGRIRLVLDLRCSSMVWEDVSMAGDVRIMQSGQGGCRHLLKCTAAQ